LVNVEPLIIFVNELGSLFADNSYSWLEADDFTSAEKYKMEEEIIGIGLSKHPLLEIAENPIYKTTSVSQLVKDTDATLLVQIESIRIIRTKSSGQQMAFLSVTDTKKKLDVTLFPEQFSKFKQFLKEGDILYVFGRVKERDNRLQLVLSDVKSATLKKYWILTESHANDNEIATILDRFPGDTPVIIHYQNTKETIQIKGKSIEFSSDLEDALKQLVLKTVYQQK